MFYHGIVNNAETTAKLKAIANPVRRKLLDALVRRRFARATDLAADLGIPANKVSFHLRVLADAGFIEDDAGRARDKRDRVWKLTGVNLRLGDIALSGDGRRLAGAVVDELFTDHQDLVRRVALHAGERFARGRDTEVGAASSQRGVDGDIPGTLSKAAATDATGDDHVYFSHARVLLTAQQMDDAVEQFRATIEACDARNKPDMPNVSVWDVDLLAADDQVRS